MPITDKGKGKAVQGSSPGKKRKSTYNLDSDESSEGRRKRQKSSSPDSPGSKLGLSVSSKKRKLAPEEQTGVEGRLSPENPYLFTGRLKHVIKLKDDNPFYERYEEDRFGKLGIGSFGSVGIYRDKKSNKTVAVKIVDKDEIWVETPAQYYKLAMYCEAACFTKILPKHKHIIDVFKICESPRYLYYVMECLAKFDLKQSFRSFDNAQARTCFYRILQAINHIHQHGIVHCDLKMENICVRQDDKTDPVIIDFGCCQYNQRMVKKREPSFNEGEVFTRKELLQMMLVDPYDDSKELGDILEMFLTGKPRLHNPRSPTLGRYPPKPDAHPDALALLEYMQNPGLMANTTVEQLMEHPWFAPEREIHSVQPLDLV